MTNFSNEQAPERIQRSIPHCRRWKKCWRHGRATRTSSWRSSDGFLNICLPVLERAKQEEPHNAEMLERFDDLWRKLRRGLGVPESKDKRR